MTKAEQERNERRKAAHEELKAINPKAKWTNASKLTSFRNKGDAEKEDEFMAAFMNAAGEAAAEAAAKPKRKSKKANNSPTNYAKRKAQVNANVGVSGFKVNAINRRALAGARAANPGLTVAEFMESRAPRKKKNKTEKKNNLANLFKNVAPAKPKRKSKKANNSPTNYAKRKAQVNANVGVSGFKVNAIGRRALAVARAANPGLTVAEFMKSRKPRAKKNTKKNNRRVNNYNKTLRNQVAEYQRARRLAKKEELMEFKAPNRNNMELQKLLESS